jgi:FkbM family methyltransferase
MLARHWRIFNDRRAQIGLRRTLQFTLLKGLRRLLMPGVQFHFGMTAEDIVISFLVDKYVGKRDITYIDIGCHEARRISNSYLLYLNGARGLAVDLNPAYAPEFRRERRNDMFVCAALSDRAATTVVHEFTASEVNTIDAAQAEQWRGRFQAKSSRAVETTTLDDLLARHMPGAGVDVLLLDVEGHELPVLRGANLAALRPALIVCELHQLDLPTANAHPVVAFLASSGYRLISYATVNGYFVRDDLAERDR